MPFPNEHACRITSPGSFERFSRKSGSGSTPDMIFGIKGGKTSLQSMRFPVSRFSEAEARSHCQKNHGSFEAASGGVESVPIYEQTVSEALAGVKIDKAAGVISGVSLLGPVSKRGYTYSDKALNQAVPLYEGTQVFIDHPTQSEMRDRGVRSLRDLIGVVRGIRRDGDRVRGDLHLLPVEPTRSQILALAETMPKSAGMSHRADVIMSRRGGKYAVEQINSVQSLDLVTSPATVAGIFESHEGEREMAPTLEQLKTDHPDLVEQLVRESQDNVTLATITAERDTLKRRLDVIESENKTRKEQEEAKTKRATLIKAKLEEAKLPEDKVTPAFRKALEEAVDESSVIALIDDRKSILGKISGSPPRSAERKVQEAKSQERTTPDLSKIEEFGHRLGVM